MNDNPVSEENQCVWPDRLQIRDTGLHDDMGGGGQRIYTTAGRGYETRLYVRDDVDAPQHRATISGPKTEVCGARMQCYHEGCQWRELTAENLRLQQVISRMKEKAAYAQRQIDAIQRTLGSST